MATLAARLASVEAAIEAIEGGAQEITHNGRTYKRADLATLYSQRDHVELRIERESNISGGGHTVAEF